MDGFELSFSYLNYMDNNLGEAIRLLDKYMDKFFADDVTFMQDPFWKMLSKRVFTAVVLNCFYNKREVSNQNIILLFSDFDKVKVDIKEFCLNFNGIQSITFIPYLQNSSDKMLESAIDIIKRYIK